MVDLRSDLLPRFQLLGAPAWIAEPEPESCDPSSHFASLSPCCVRRSMHESI